MPRHSLRYALAALLVAIAISAPAQQIPDAGRLLEDLKPAPNLPQRAVPKIDIEERSAGEQAEGVRLHVARLRIAGAALFSEAELHALVADGEGRDLSLGELRDLAERLTRHYRDHGYFLARAYLPAQDIKNGEVEIAILEGRLGQVDIINTAGAGGAALAPLAQLRPGEATQDRTLERSLLLLSDVPGVEVKSTLKPGATVGASDLLVDVAPGRRITGSIDADTFGDRFSGQYRAGGTINANNPLQLGDQASLRALASDEQMRYFRASYQIPINSMGTRVAMAATHMHYQLGKTLAPLDAAGDAQVGSLYVRHPLVRSHTMNLYGELQFDHKKLEDRIEFTATKVNKTLNSWTAGINGDIQDGLGGGAVNSFSLGYTAGDLDLDPASRALDAATAGTAGGFGKWNLSWLRLQRITDAASLYFSAIAQVATKNLDSSEKLSLGGANGVRAYPQGEAPGDQGQLVTVEVRYHLPLALPGTWEATAFVDSGHVTINKNTWQAVANSRTLTGAGIGLNITKREGWVVKLSLAWKAGSEQPTSDGDRSPRFWGQAVKTF